MPEIGPTEGSHEGNISLHCTTIAIIIIMIVLIATPLTVAGAADTNLKSSNNDSSDIDYTSVAGSVSFVSPDENATVQNPVAFEMEATNFTIEPASSGVSDGAGHLHILVDQDPVSPGEVIPNNETNGYYHYGGGQTSAEIELEPGNHTIRLQAGDANHKAYNLTDSINISAEDSSDTPESTFTIDNIGSSAWDVSSANEAYVETSGGDNPTITLQTGVRYTINNEGWSTHPLAFRDVNGARLLSQGSNDVGDLEDDVNINWSDSGRTLSFTLTDELANELDSYICTVHPQMEGSIEIEESLSDSNDSAPDVTGNEAPATDPGGDGLYEDVNGDGEVGFADLTALYRAFNSGAIDDTNSQFFNFNGEGGVGFADITALYNNELQQGG